MASRGRRVLPYLLVLPNVGLVGAFAAYPLVYSLILSVQDWRVNSTSWVGLANYTRLTRDPVFILALKNTLLYVAGTVPLSLALALMLAVGLNRRFLGHSVLRVSYLLPSLISGVTVGVLWQWMYSPSYGILNATLQAIGLPSSTWLQNPRLTLPLIMVTGVWAQAGYYMVIYLAGLQSIPATYYEAAVVDGAGLWAQFRSITLPLLSPVTFLILVLATVAAFKVFDVIYVMTGGGPGRASLVLVLYMYQSAFEGLHMSYASAMAVVLFVVMFALTLVQVRFFRRE